VSMRVLVLDLTHGGDILAREYATRGWDTTAVDIYHNSAEAASRLEREGVRCLQRSPSESFDLAVIPVHAPVSFLSPARAEQVITHHQAVRDLASFAYPTVEITGVRGKTSTSQVLSFLLARDGRKVLSLTSSGLSSVGEEIKVLEDKVSIAPATLLRISRQYRDFDIAVLEVSLGGTGLANVSVVTGLQEDYPIAARTRRAYDGKRQMIALAQDNVVYPEDERGTWGPLVPAGLRSFTFGVEGDLDVAVRANGLGESATLYVTASHRIASIDLRPGYLSVAYAPAFACALTTMMALGKDPLRFAETLSSFPGAPGRGEVVKDGKGVWVRERNPGVSSSSLEYQLKMLVQEYGCRDIGLLLDPVNRKVCEKLDLCKVSEVCDRFPEVSGRYVLPSGADLADRAGFEMIRSMEEVRDRHGTMLWATKEGYL